MPKKDKIRISIPEGSDVPKTAAEYQSLINKDRPVNKYNNEIIEIIGLRFDSKKEAKRFHQLSWMKDQGLITDFKRQVKYTLLPAIKHIAREKYYKADFVIYYPDDRIEVEDTKGVRTEKFQYQFHLMYIKYGIKIKLL